MARAKKTGKKNEDIFAPALTEAGREAQMISLAFDLAEKRLREGTASSQVITHYLKMGSEKEKLERERLRNENKLTLAKVEALKSAERIEELYNEAIKAMRRYNGSSTDYDEEYDDYEELY